MKKYICPQLGACQKATAGEIFERESGANLKCPECGHLLDLHYSESASTSGKRVPMAAWIGLGVALVAAGAGWAVMGRSIEPQTLATAGLVSPTAPNSGAVTNPSPIAPSNTELSQQKASAQIKLSEGDGVAAESSSAKAVANEMIKLGIAQMAQSKLDNAESSFRAALKTDPKQSLAYYNIAILRLRQGRSDDALKEFEAAFMAGFQHYDQLDQDRDLDAIKKDHRFVDLLKRYRPADAKTSVATTKK